MESRRILGLGLLLSLMGMMAVGCSDPYKGRVGFTGTVKLVGEPLKEGSISFEPQEKQGTQTGAPIQNGAYKVERKDGLKPGKYLVRITAGDGKTPSEEEAGNPGGSTNIVSFDLIPEDWNVNSKQFIDIKDGSGVKHDFNIPTKNTPKKRR